MRAHYTSEHHTKNLPSDAGLLSQYKRWEAGEVEPDLNRADPFYKPLIAATFSTVTHAMFPVAPKRDADSDVLAVAGMDTWSWSAASSGPTWIRPRSTDFGSWPTGCARSTRSCPSASSWPKAAPSFAESSPSRASASP